MKISAIWELQAELQAAQANLERLKMLATTIGTSRTDGVPKSTTATSQVEALTVKIVDAETRLTELVDDMTAAEVDLSLEIVARVTGKAVDVMILRYVHCLPFAAIMRELDYSESTIFRLHRRGLKEFNAVELKSRQFNSCRGVS